jgi:hypothetical protein
MTKGFTLIAGLAAVVATVAACTHKEDAPTITGPSGLSTSVSGTPVANFQIQPNPIDLSQQPNGGTVKFDATGSCGAPLPASGACQSPVASFQFAFSDGTTASGPVVFKHFSDDAIGTLSVLLVVTNSTGAAASATESAQVLRSPPPKADFTFTPPPTLPGPGNVTVFFADTSTVVPPRVVRSESWDFLDGRSPTTGPSVPHVFSVDSTSTFLVVLTVTDDLGQTSTSAKPVTVTVTPPTTTTPPSGTGAKGHVGVH